jgi:hypothetical protein
MLPILNLIAIAIGIAIESQAPSDPDSDYLLFPQS